MNSYIHYIIWGQNSREISSQPHTRLLGEVSGRGWGPGGQAARSGGCSSPQLGTGWRVTAGLGVVGDEAGWEEKLRPRAGRWGMGGPQVGGGRPRTRVGGEAEGVGRAEAAGGNGEVADSSFS